MLSALFISIALAQNALDGNLQRGGGALDAPLQQGVTRNAQRGSQDYRSRNLVVTGDVAAGRGFRGSVGYTAAADFRGATSGDTTRVFRAESATSSAQAIAAIPMNDRFSLATKIGQTAYLRDFSSTNPVGTTGVVGTAQSTATGGNTSRGSWDRNFAPQISRAEANDARARRDVMTQQAASSADFSAMYRPATLTVMLDARQNQIRLLSNPFMGIVTVPNNDLIESINQGVYGSALLRDDLRSGRADGARLQRSYLSGLIAEKSPSAAPAEMLTGLQLDSKKDEKLDGKVDTKSSTAVVTLPTTDAGKTGIRQIAEIRTPYDRVLNAVGNRSRKAQGDAVADDAPLDVPTLSLMGSAIREVRNQLQMNPPDPMDETERLLNNQTGEKPKDGAQQLPDASTETDGSADNGADKGGADSSSSSKPTTGDGATGTQIKLARRLTADEAYLLMAHGQTMSQLDGGTKEALDVMLQAGEQSMRAKRYLSAEREFITGALIAPANPLPVAGMANSEVAAGLQIAASISIRRLFQNWPEMIDTRYGLDILGSEERLRKIGEESITLAEGSKYAADYGLVGAYVGHQLGDRSLVERGLEIMARNQQETTLVQALRVIWLRTSNDVPALAQPEPQPEPAAQPPITDAARPSN